MALSINVLRTLDFKRLLFARAFAVLGLQAQAVIVGWQVYSLSHDVFILGLVGLCEAVPAIFSAFFSGHIVDNSRPHRIYCLALGFLAVNALALLVIAGGLMPVSVPHQIWFIFACVFLSGIARSFIMPASFILLSRIVARPDIPAASAWMSSGFQLSAILGPALAGLVYGGYGQTVAWCLPVLFLTLSVGMGLMMSIPHRVYRSAEKREPTMVSIKAGWSFILGNHTLLSVMALDMFAVLFGGAVSMLPAFADQVLHVGSEGLGLLRAAPAAGSILMGLFLALKPLKKVRARTLLWAVVGFGVTTIGFGFSSVFWLATLFLALSGAFDNVSMVIRGTLMQLLVPEGMRGRVSSVNGMFIISSNEIGAFESGTAASFFGLVPSIIIGGCLTLVVVATTAFISPKLRCTVIDTEALP